jgi:hypothetical protein
MIAEDTAELMYEIGYGNEEEEAPEQGRDAALPEYVDDYYDKNVFFEHRSK